MVSARTATAIIGLLAGLLVSAVLWWYFDTLLFLLVVPFVPFLFRRGESERKGRSPVLECPVCGFQTREESYDYCPQDGHRLE